MEEPHHADRVPNVGTDGSKPRAGFRTHLIDQYTIEIVIRIRGPTNSQSQCRSASFRHRLDLAGGDGRDVRLACNSAYHRTGICSYGVHQASASSRAIICVMISSLFTTSSRIHHCGDLQVQYIAPEEERPNKVKCAWSC